MWDWNTKWHTPVGTITLLGILVDVIGLTFYLYLRYRRNNRL